MRRTPGTLLLRAPHLPDRLISDYLKRMKYSVKNAGVTEQKGDLPPEPPANDVPVVCETENANH